MFQASVTISLWGLCPPLWAVGRAAPFWHRDWRHYYPRNRRALWYRPLGTDMLTRLPNSKSSV